jgi:hypothetical protein
MGWRRLLVASLAGLMLSTACSDSAQQSPATAPPTSDATTTTSEVTATSAPPPSTTTIPAAATRLVEVEEIFRDLEFRRLDALYRNDEAAFRALFANEAYLEEGLRLGVLDTDVPVQPTLELVRYLSFELLIDREDCLAARITTDLSDVYVGSDPFTSEHVLMPRDDGWGFAWTGAGWLCDGPHPLES